MLCRACFRCLLLIVYTCYCGGIRPCEVFAADTLEVRTTRDSAISLVTAGDVYQAHLLARHYAARPLQYGVFSRMELRRFAVLVDSLGYRNLLSHELFPPDTWESDRYYRKYYTDTLRILLHGEFMRALPEIRQRVEIDTLLTSETRDALDLILTIMADTSASFRNKTTSLVESKAQAFSETYPRSSYRKLVRQRLLGKDIPLMVAFGWDFGAGNLNFGGQLGDNISVGSAWQTGVIVGQRFKVGVHAAWAGGLIAKQSFQAEDEWPALTRLRYRFTYASVSYDIIQVPRFIVSPMAGFGFTDIEWKTDHNHDFGQKLTPVTGGTLICELFGSKGHGTASLLVLTAGGWISFPGFGGRYEELSGNPYYFGLSVGWFGRNKHAIGKHIGRED